MHEETDRRQRDLAVCRILVIDDNPAIHEDFRKIFGHGCAPSTAFTDAEAALFGDAPLSPNPHAAAAAFQINQAMQGQEGLAAVREARLAHRPYTMVFVDVRMPPGWDGIETTVRIWAEDPDVQVVICTAYSDYSWAEMLAKLGRSDRLVILKKPFDNIEVLQLASALSEKWRLNQQVRQRIQDLEQRCESLSSMSDDVRRPLGQVIGTSELLLGTQLDAEQRDYAETIRDSARASLAAVNLSEARLLDAVSPVVRRERP